MDPNRPGNDGGRMAALLGTVVLAAALVAGLLMMRGRQTEETIGRQQRTPSQILSDQEFEAKFRTMRHESLTLTPDVSGPEDLIIIKGVLHTSEPDIFRGSVSFLVASFITPNNIIGSEGALNVTYLGGGRFEYQAGIQAPVPRGPYILHVRYAGRHILATSPFEVR